MMLTVSAPDADAPVNRFNVLATVLTPLPIFTIVPAVLTLAIETVGAPAPFAIRTLSIPEDEPKVSAPVCAVPPIVIVPVVVAAPIVYVEAAMPFSMKLPDPTANDNEPAPVASPIEIALAAFVPIFTVVADVPLAMLTVFVALSEPMLIVFPPPTMDKFPAPAVNVTAPLEPPIVVAAEPVEFIRVVPTIVVEPVILDVPVTVTPPVCTVMLADEVNVPNTSVFPVTLPILTGPVPPLPIFVVAPPVVFILAVPAVVNVVKVPGPATDDPNAGGDAKTAAKLEGLIA